MAPSDLAQGLGWVGSLFSGVGYVAVSTGLLRGDRATFQILNVLGATGLGIAAVSAGVWPSATMNAVWILIGLATLVGQRRRRGVRRGTGRLARNGREQGDQLVDGVAGLERVPEGPAGGEVVAVAPSLSPAGQVFGPDEVVEDELHAALGDADAFGELPDPHRRVSGDREQHVTVVGQQRPAGG